MRTPEKFAVITLSESELLLVTRQNDNHSPGPGPGRLVPSPHQRSEPINTILGTFRESGRAFQGAFHSTLKFE